MIKTFLFDFGGVVAEEGFREGLLEIARENRLDPGHFFRVADQVVYESGYLTGAAGEQDFWNMLRERTGIRGADADLRAMILKRFVLKPQMLQCVKSLRSGGWSVVLLSDQTNWLDEINRKTGLFSHFDAVYNSIHTHISKRDPAAFSTVCRMLNVYPEEAVFIDDNEGHIKRAAAAGLQTIHFKNLRDFLERLTLLTGISC